MSLWKFLKVKRLIIRALIDQGTFDWEAFVLQTCTTAIFFVIKKLSFIIRNIADRYQNVKQSALNHAHTIMLPFRTVGAGSLSHRNVSGAHLLYILVVSRGVIIHLETYCNSAVCCILSRSTILSFQSSSSISSDAETSLNAASVYLN